MAVKGNSRFYTLSNGKVFEISTYCWCNAYGRLVTSKVIRDFSKNGRVVYDIYSKVDNYTRKTICEITDSRNHIYDEEGNFISTK